MKPTPSELQHRLEAERAGSPFVVYRQPDAGQVVRALSGQSRLTIGRADDADITLSADPEVSRTHAEMQLVGGSWLISDDGLSQNGTFLNGERLVQRRRLQGGDMIRVGSTVLEFVDPRSHDELGTARSSDADDPQAVTETQRRVLIALCRPLETGDEFATPATNASIAAETFMSVSAVKAHLRALSTLFGVSELPQNEKRARVAAIALRRGVISPRDLA